MINIYNSYLRYLMFYKASGVNVKVKRLGPKKQDLNSDLNAAKG